MRVRVGALGNLLTLSSTFGNRHAAPRLITSIAAQQSHRPFDQIHQHYVRMPALETQGVCVAVKLPPRCDEHFSCKAAIEQLAHLEREYAANKLPKRYRRAEFIAGRLALRRALLLADYSNIDQSYAFLKNDVGAPELTPNPGYFLPCSVSHTTNVAVGFIAKHNAVKSLESSEVSIGVDIENATRATNVMAKRRILSPAERLVLGTVLKGRDVGVELTLRFSLKEAIFKALHPLIMTHIPWHQVQVYPQADGSCVVELASQLSDATQGSIRAETRWTEFGCGKDVYFLSTAAAQIVS